MANAFFDNLIDWWGFEDAAAGLAAVEHSGLFRDKVVDYGGVPHDGHYSGALEMYYGTTLEERISAGSRATWKCADEHSIFQWPNGFGIQDTPLDPQLGHNRAGGGYIGFDSSTPWWDLDYFTFGIWVNPWGGYYMSRGPLLVGATPGGGASSPQYICGDSLGTPTTSGGWNFVVYWPTVAYTGPPLYNTLHDPITRYFYPAGVPSFFCESMGGSFPLLSLGTGPGWSFLSMTSDGTTIKTFRNAEQTDEVSGFNPGTGADGITFGARNNRGDGYYSMPLYGEFDEALMWEVPKTSAQLKDIMRACDLTASFHTKFFAKRAPAHNSFSKPTALRTTGACQASPWDVAGLGTQSGEPTGANVLELHQTRWLTFAPNASGDVTFHTTGVPGDDYSESPGDSSMLYQTLTVWTGTSLGSLSEVDSVDDAQAGLTVTLSAGTTYRLQVGTGKKGCNGVAALAWF